ncbi:FHA domain-containing protein [Aureliella helgolandensis]|uniref:FHA domain-containing protein FhaB n=1 Tax=Aureliella helgolandensis TaxID=2527968 RepID=A0A518G7Y8_9BACT|nr:FHA domain-containing protein [Aureliella helgolandensis]QDV24693.1 FHA domain-containing protein FhaB [Aureliella helgolandensis]
MAEYGQLVPTGGGDSISLKKDKLLVGRRESCDIVLRFANVSSQHALLTLEAGYWFCKDLGSRNGTKVENLRISRKRLDPGTVIAFAKHAYTVDYDPEALGAFGAPPPDDDHMEEVLRRGLMDRAGLSRRDDKDPFANRNLADDD